MTLLNSALEEHVFVAHKALLSFTLNYNVLYSFGK